MTIEIHKIERVRTDLADPAVMWWLCPQCGRETVATRKEKATIEQIQADPRCVVCRSKQQQA